MIGSTVYLSQYREGQRFLEVWRGDRMVALVAVDEDKPYQLGEAYQIDEAMNPTPWPMESDDAKPVVAAPPEWKLGPPDPAPMCRECGRQFYHRDRCSLTGSVELAKVLR